MDIGNARRMGVMRGVQSLLVGHADTADEALAAVERSLVDTFGASAGDKAVFTLGLPLYKEGSTNTLKVVVV